VKSPDILIGDKGEERTGEGSEEPQSQNPLVPVERRTNRSEKEESLPAEENAGENLLKRKNPRSKNF